MTIRRPIRRFLLVLGLAVLAVLPARPVAAGGFEYPAQGARAVGRAGAFTVKADDPTALFWNPGKLALLRGTRLLYNHQFVDQDLTFQRTSTLDPISGEMVAFAPVSERDEFFPLGMALGLTSDFGLEDWTFALGVYGPNSPGTSAFCNKATSATRYAFIEKDVMLLFYTASVAWKYEELFGVGASLQYVDNPRLKYSMMLDGKSDSPARPMNNPFDIQASFDVSDRAGFSAILGAWYRPWRFLEVAASARVVPVYVDAKGSVTIEPPGPTSLLHGNDLYVCDGAMSPEQCLDAISANPTGGSKAPKLPATISLQLPATFQLGARYVHMDGEREVFDVEVDFVWEHWGSMKAFDVNFEDRILAVPGLTAFAIRDMQMVRNFQDTYSVRVGGDWNAIPGWLTVRAGALWESGALPEAYTHIDYPSFDMFGVAAGATVSWNGLDLTVAYARLIQLERNVSLDEARVRQIRVSTQGVISEGLPVNAGRFTSHYDVLSFALGVHFDELFD